VLDSLENVPRVRGPLFIEHRTEDEMFPPAWASKLQAAHPGAQVEIVKECTTPDRRAPVRRPRGIR